MLNINLKILVKKILMMTRLYKIYKRLELNSLLKNEFKNNHKKTMQKTQKKRHKKL